ncbi:two-component system response regulator [Pseudomonas aeruginosa BWH035]|nr:two-component system response regulator [Pseudomonas aeruginosa BWH035]MCR3863054.1 response regulator [Pseudomonas aeruginosa]
MRVLIVEDEAKTADYLNRGLSEQGFTVDLADNGIDGRHLALHGEYDVIVLDVMLPGVDGYGVLRALRERRQTPVIMLTARERVEDRVRGLREGADDYLIKPFSFLELVARLQALTRRGGNHESHSQMRIADLSIDLLSRKVCPANAAANITKRSCNPTWRSWSGCGRSSTTCCSSPAPTRDAWPASARKPRWPARSPPRWISSR